MEPKRDFRIGWEGYVPGGATSSEPAVGTILCGAGVSPRALAKEVETKVWGEPQRAGAHRDVRQFVLVPDGERKELSLSVNIGWLHRRRWPRCREPCSTCKGC